MSDTAPLIDLTPASLTEYDRQSWQITEAGCSVLAGYQNAHSQEPKLQRLIRTAPLPVAITTNDRGHKFLQTIRPDDLVAYIRIFSTYFNRTGKLTVAKMKQLAQANSLSSNNGIINSIKSYMVKHHLISVAYVDRGRQKTPWGPVTKVHLAA